MRTLEKTQVTNDTLINGMNEFLANMQIFYQNLRGFHWNVTGNLFFVLHSKFEEYYNETAEAVDEVAERILMVGGQPIHSFSQYIQIADIQEVTDVHDGKEAVKIIISQSETLHDRMNRLKEVANDQNDETTATLFSDLMAETEKRIWMLKTFLK